jgi:hypothetical protein
MPGCSRPLPVPARWVTRHTPMALTVTPSNRSANRAAAQGATVASKANRRPSDPTNLHGHCIDLALQRL